MIERHQSQQFECFLLALCSLVDSLICIGTLGHFEGLLHEKLLYSEWMMDRWMED